MSIKQVADQIKKKYKVGQSAETICWEVKKVHVGKSPMKMGPVGRIPRRDYRFLCDAFASFTASNQKRKLAEACQTTVDIGHTALGRMEEMKKKELVLAAATMSNE